MKRQNKIKFSLKKKIIILLLSLLLIIFLGFFIFSIFKTYQSPTERKLIGFWNVEMENSFWERDSVYDWGTTIMDISEKNICKLPTLCDTNLTVDENWAKATGTWEFISRNPDSIFLNVPNNPLHGKYAIRFFIDENGYGEAKNNIYKIELKNDSTYLICNKGDFIQKNWRKDWEKN
ncbi:MAG TPA: hypothetical protein DD434_03615 [Bacteroidales bacterium]|nr:hypothetical protein [Bacteroidales bacterium]